MAKNYELSELLTQEETNKIEFWCKRPRNLVLRGCAAPIVANLMIKKAGYENCSDLHMVGADGKILKDDISVLEEKFLTAPNKDKKLFVIFNAHTMSSETSDKLLKEVEENNTNVFLFVGDVSATIKSRCLEIVLPKLLPESLLNSVKESTLFEYITEGNLVYAE